MKLFLLIGFFIVCASGNTIVPREGGRNHYVPDNEGNVNLADSKDLLKAALFFDAFRHVKLYVYTRLNPINPDVVLNGNIDELANTHLNTSNTIKIIIHGWLQDWNSEINYLIKDAFLNAMDCNVIVVDWSYGGSTILYPAASSRVSSVGKFVAKVVDWLVDYGVNIKNFHIAGHDLGAHVAGYAGRNVKTGRLPYITGMDPSLLLWNTIPSFLYKGVKSRDGDYVEIIHTDSGISGILNDVGHADFYPNGGSLQPGCFGLNACSHDRSYKYFADSLDHKRFVATKCGSVLQATTGLCWGSKLHMGGAQPKSKTGIYYLKTNKKQPYYRG